MTHQNPTLTTETPDISGEPAGPWMPRQEWVKTQPQALVASCVVLLDQQGRMLMLRYAESEPSGGTWWLPGGMLDHGEDPLTAARREMYEETGVTVSPAPRLIGYDHRVDVGGTGPALDFFWYGGSVADNPTIRLSPEHDRHVFLGLDELTSTPLAAHMRTLEALHTAATTGTVVCLREGQPHGPDDSSL
ncbi:NUDIX hydrolase [Streptomyces sp. NPDC058239]|uniref:NUDIX hydrolase n=1 Tax=Streptomyces sp. NPDC058239 TaxID=3346395 RepID=UPI0036ECF629